MKIGSPRTGRPALRHRPSHEGEAARWGSPDQEQDAADDVIRDGDRGGDAVIRRERDHRCDQRRAQPRGRRRRERIAASAVAEAGPRGSACGSSVTFAPARRAAPIAGAGPGARRAHVGEPPASRHRSSPPRDAARARRRSLHARRSAPRFARAQRELFALTGCLRGFGTPSARRRGRWRGLARLTLADILRPAAVVGVEAAVLDRNRSLGDCVEECAVV